MVRRINRGPKPVGPCDAAYTRTRICDYVLMPLDHTHGPGNQLLRLFPIDHESAQNAKSPGGGFVPKTIIETFWWQSTLASWYK